MVATSDGYGRTTIGTGAVGGSGFRRLERMGFWYRLNYTLATLGVIPDIERPFDRTTSVQFECDANCTTLLVLTYAYHRE
jgi:hypothetical protein